jgi:hypothetical protein
MTTKKTKFAPILEDLDNLVPLETEEKQEEEEEEEGTEEDSIIQPVVKPKRQLTENQKAALAAGRAKGREKLNQKHNEINEKRKAREAELAKLKEESEARLTQAVVKKAINIKKKELISKINIDTIDSDDDSDDEIPVEVVRKIIAKQQAKQAKAGQQVIPKVQAKAAKAGPPRAPGQEQQQQQQQRQIKPTPVALQGRGESRAEEEEYKPVHRFNPTQAYGYKSPQVKFNFIS